MSNIENNFYMGLEIIYNEIFNKYGFTPELINSKTNIIKLYERCNEYNGNDIVEKISIKNYKMTEDGKIINLL